MAKYNKTNWTGGINQFVDPTKIDENVEYFSLVNGRTRRNRVDTIKVPLDITTGLPATGNVQGIYSVDNYLIVFINGEAWYRNFDPDNNTWTKIIGLALSATAPEIFLELVPASYVNFTRIANDSTDAGKGVKLGGSSTGSPRCAVVMDGESQPWVIFPNATARVIKTFAQWTPTDREYVPAACKYPLWRGNILYCIGKDKTGVFNQIYRSVSGRPLDFVVAVNGTTGDKISAVEEDSGAPAVSYRVDYGETTALAKLPSVNDAFELSTVRNSYLVIPNFDSMIYGEPTFNNNPLFSVGALNNNCIVDILADTAVVHYSGIRTFNAILNLRFEGKNAPFSQKIEGLISDIVQSHAAATTFDNYAIFSLQTVHGPAILWYDTLNQSWASIDQFTGVSTVKQFAVTLTRTSRRLFFVTTDNKLFEYFAGAETAPCKLFIKDFTPATADSEHSVANVRMHFSPPVTGGYVQAELFVDKRLVNVKAREMSAANVIVSSNVPSPYAISSTGGIVCDPVQFAFREQGIQGFRTGVLFTWSAEMSLETVVIETQESTSPSSEAIKVSSPTMVRATDVIVIGNDGNTDAQRVALNKTIKRLNPDYVIGTGNIAYDSGTLSEIAARWTPYWSNYRQSRKYFSVPGNRDLDTDNGEPFFSTLLQSPTRYFTIETPWANIYMLNSGINSVGTQIEPDNLNEATIEESTQMQWLRTQLAASSTKHNIVVFHHPPYSSASGGYVSLQNIPFASWGASLVINGHDTLYERLYKDDITYLITGTGSYGAGFLPADILTDGSQAVKLNTLGYIKLRIWPLVMEICFVDTDGNEYDNFVIRR